MTQLLVSVRNDVEAMTALQGGADLLDVKEPNSGSLGQADCEIIQSCSKLAMKANVPCSAALGELLDGPMSSARRLRDTTGLAFAKVGLARTATDREWTNKLELFWRDRPLEVSPVAVVYADWQRAQSPAPEDVLKFASDFSCGAVLVDTFFKDGQNLLGILGEKAIRDLVEAAHRDGLTIVLAGSLGISQLATIRELGADIVAVRGAVCQGARTASVDADLVRQIKLELSLSPC